jgi:ribosome-associated translation inhibitor RaiA
MLSPGRTSAHALIAFATTLIALAITVTAAYATTDRTEYAAQVNTICRSANAQQKQLYEAFEQAIDRLDAKEKKARGRKVAKIEQAIERLFNQIPVQSLAIADAEHAQVKQIAPAPGDEALVSEWVGINQSVLDLNRQIQAIERRAERLFDAPFKGHSIRAFGKRDRKQKRLERQANGLYQQLEPLYDRYVEVGTQLGATYCVTSATGSS